MIKDHQYLPASFLTDRVLTIELAESKNMVQTKVSPDPVPFGYLHHEWLKLKRKMRDGDHIREFQTPVCTGIALIRGDRIITFIATRVNAEELDRRQAAMASTKRVDDPWRHIENGKFEQAIEEYTTWIADGKPGYMSRGIAHLNLGRFDLARDDFVAGEKNAPFRSDAYFEWIATVDWLSGKEQQAQAIWLESVRRIQAGSIDYTDAAGGVSSGLLLWFASVATGDVDSKKEAIDFLQSRIFKPKGGRRSAQNWPGPIAKFVIGHGNSQELLTSVSSFAILRERQLSQVHFCLGVHYISLGDGAGAAEALQATVRLKKLIDIEYYLAVNQLHRLKNVTRRMNA